MANRVALFVGGNQSDKLTHHDPNLRLEFPLKLRHTGHMNDAFNLGVALECTSRGVSVGSFPKMAGVARAMALPEAAEAKRLVVKTAHDLMALCGDGRTAPAYHLQLLIDTPGWSAHADDVYGTLVKACALCESLEKHAFADAVEGAGNLAKGIGYAGVLGGAGLGSLYWYLSRHATQDDADIEAKKQQVKYYHNLNRELKDSLQRRYQYGGAAA